MRCRFLSFIFILAAGATAGAACTKPTITSPRADPDPSGRQITITWTTSVAADSQVTYGWINAGQLTQVTDTSGVTSHSVTVTGLFPSTSYGWGIISHAISGGAQCTYPYWAFYGGGDQDVEVVTNAAPAGSADYYLALNNSPQHVTQGYGVYLRLWNGLLAGTIGTNVLKFVVTGLPNNVSLTWTDPRILGSNEQIVSTTTIPNDTLTIHDFGLAGAELYILTNQGGTTTPGTYTLTFTGSGAGIPTHTFTWNFVVDPAESPFGITFPFGTPSSYPAIPALSTFLSAASTWGAYNCAQDLRNPRTIRPNDTGSQTTSITSVSPGTVTITVGSTARYSSEVSVYPLVIAYATSAQEFVLVGDWSVVDGTHLKVTFANSHAQPYSVRVYDLTPVSGSFTRGSWYYDGARVYYNVGDLLGDQITYQQCVQNVNQVYRDGYVIPNSGGIQSFLGFTTGLLEDYQRQETASDLTAINELDTSSQPYLPGGNAVPVQYLQREAAYAFKFARDAVTLRQNNPRFGQSSTFWRGYYLDHVIGHLDEICLTGDYEYEENFMVGLEADAIINYYEAGNHDARIPSAIKCVADFLWNTQWNVVSTDTNSFAYDSYRAAVNLNPANAPASYFQNLNNLIAPMYAWLFKMTGLPRYQTEGDTIFEHGTSLDGPDGGPANIIGDQNGPPNGNSGKEFSQQYMWGPSYVTWRSTPETDTSPFGQLAPPTNLSIVVH
jgi:hypothetical protein